MSARTPGQWKWWTSCSWRRLRSEIGHGKTVDVLMPCVQRDGHPDIIVSGDDMKLIEAAPAMLAALRAVDALWTENALNFADDMALPSPVGIAWKEVKDAIAAATQ